MPYTFWQDDAYAGEAHLHTRFGQNDGDANDTLTVDITWPDGRTRRLTRIMNSTYRRTYGTDSAIIVAHTSADRIADQVRLGLVRPKEHAHGES